MTWWQWALILWLPIALALALVIGLSIRHADRVSSLPTPITYVHNHGMTTTHATECNHCRYTAGHTSWCPNGTGAPLVSVEEQAAVEQAIAERDATPAIAVESVVRIAPLFCNERDRDHRLVVEAIDEQAITARFLHNDKVVRLAARALVLAE